MTAGAIVKQMWLCARVIDMLVNSFENTPDLLVCHCRSCQWRPSTRAVGVTSDAVGDQKTAALADPGAPDAAVGVALGVAARVAANHCADGKASTTGADAAVEACARWCSNDTLAVAAADAECDTGAGESNMDGDSGAFESSVPVKIRGACAANKPPPLDDTNVWDSDAALATRAGDSAGGGDGSGGGECN